LLSHESKRLSGGDTISARHLYAEFFEFKPEFKLWLATNHRPTIRGTDTAIWRRIRLIPFTVTIPPACQDKRLPEKLKEELPGILAWAVRGLPEMATTWAQRTPGSHTGNRGISQRDGYLGALHW
jgi:putative DNA primase/helicase